MVYFISGTFFKGMDWEDFINKNGLVNFTISQDEIASGPTLADDGFVDVTVVEPLTRDLCEKIISNYIGMDVTIIELHTCVAAPNND